MELKKFDTAGEILFRAIVRAMANLKDKQAFLRDMDAAAERRAGEAANAQAEVAETESKDTLNVTKANHLAQR